MPDIVVKTEEGYVKGKKVKGCFGNKFFSFLGIPYAEAPIKELRFKAPIAKKPWLGVLNATKGGPPCPSKHMFFRFYVGAEDNCLHLNVHTRNIDNKTNPKPVMVWIHGGAFLMGCNQNKFFGPDYLMMEDIVLVSINYRLGIFGFLCLEDESLGVPGNAGLKDMVLALEWVKRNINHFDGDPNNVTIFGESAGAVSVHYLCLSPMTKGLFHKAIAQSGCVFNSWAKGCSNGQIIAKYLKFEGNEKEFLQFLKSVTPKKLVTVQDKLQIIITSDSPVIFGPVVEKPSTFGPAFLLQHPHKIIENGNFHKVPFIIGFTSNEGLLYQLALKILPPSLLCTSNFELDINYDLNLNKGCEQCKEIVNKIEEFYFANEGLSKNNFNKLFALKTDTQFLHGILRTTNCQKLKSDRPIYLYRMSLDTSLNLVKQVCITKHLYLYGTIMIGCYYFHTFKKILKSLPKTKLEGVCHGDDVCYLFRSFHSPKVRQGSIEEISIKRFVKMWTNFARTGNPTPQEQNDFLNIQWKPVSKSTNFFLDIGTELKMEENPEQARMNFWDEIYSKYS